MIISFKRNHTREDMEKLTDEKQLEENNFEKIRKGKLLEKKYVFPYELFENGSKVVIYGAGNVGRKIYQMAKIDKRVKIVGVVDRKADILNRTELPVMKVEELVNLDYDYILISVENQKVALEIKTELGELGISESNIKWLGSSCYKSEMEKEWEREKRELNKFMKQFIGNERKRFFLFMLPEHGNMGDYVIGYAEQLFLKKYFPEYDLISVTKNEWIFLYEDIKKLVHCEDVIFISGGGYFGNIWYDSSEICKEIVREFPQNQKIFFPNNLTYKEGISVDNQDLMEDLKWYKEQPNTHFFFRTYNSYEFCKEWLNCYYSPDIALSLKIKKEPNREATDILLCLRSDEEKSFGKTEELKSILDKCQRKYDQIDIHLKQYIAQDEGWDCLKNLIDIIQNHSVLITDRLHGMILATISNVPCIAFDNSTHKVSGVYEWLKDRENVRMVTANRIEDIDKILMEVEKISVSEYDGLPEAFDAMSEIIKRIIIL